MITYKLRILDDCGTICNEVVVDEKTCEFLIGLIEATLKELKKFEFECKMEKDDVS
jgi:chemotaxis protein CheY-P-specific phosphatase CheC